VGARLGGALLFLPVPAVLALFTQQPLGAAPSLALGVVLMASHRLYARSYALLQADRRCLWCGGTAGEGPVLEVAEPIGLTRWRACGADHASRVAGLLTWAGAQALFLRVGILGTLLVFLLAAWPASAGRLGSVRTADAVAFFRLGIALTVLPLSILGARLAPASGTLPAPFPVHIQALIGTRWVLWLFRIVGTAWFALGTLHVGRCLRLAW
jgi:hypothetical protein